MRDERRNYAMVGLFVVAMTAALLWWLATLAGRAGPTDAYSIRYRNVMGLIDGAQILFEGYPVGVIENIERVDGPGDAHFRVDAAIQKDWQIPADSEAEITSANLLGGVVIDIRGGSSPISLEPGDTIASRETANVFAAMNDLAQRLGVLLETQIEPLLESVSEGATPLIGEVRDLTQELTRTVSGVNRMLEDENLARVERTLANLEASSNEIAGFTSELGATRVRLDTLLERIDSFVVENETEADHMLGDLHHSLEVLVRHVDAIAHNLEVTSRNMNEFSRQVRENPGVLVRGREVGDDGGPSQ